MPLPTMTTPSSRSGASALPRAMWRAGSRSRWIDSITTGISAFGSTIRKGTKTPWSKPRVAFSPTARPAASSSRLTSAASFGLARRGIAELIGVRGKAVIVEQHPRRGGGADGGLVFFPMRGDDDERLRALRKALDDPGEIVAQAVPGVRPERRRKLHPEARPTAVRQEDRGLANLAHASLDVPGLRRRPRRRYARNRRKSMERKVIRPCTNASIPRDLAIKMGCGGRDERVASEARLDAAQRRPSRHVRV